VTDMWTSIETFRFAC